MTSLIVAPALMAQTLPSGSIERATGLTELAPQTAKPMPQGSNAKPITLNGLAMEQQAYNLGEISAITQDKAGTVYTLDQKSGRVFALYDRNSDGRFDNQRVIASGFISPSGLTWYDGFLYISDERALWSFNTQNNRQAVLASLGNMSADAAPRPIVHHNNTIYLGLTQKGKGKVVSVDVQTGQAALIKQFTAGPVTALAVQNDAQIWIGLGNGLAALSDEAALHPIETSAPLKGMAFTPPDLNIEGWPEAIEGALYISQGQTHSTASGGYNIIAVQSRFGAINNKAAIVADGFYHQRSNRIWAQPESLLFDVHGLLVGDRLGTLWRVKAGQKDPRPSKTQLETAAIETPKQKPSAERGVTTPMQGSLIGSASQLNKGSTLKVGSTLIEKYDAEKAAKEDAIAQDKSDKD